MRACTSDSDFEMNAEGEAFLRDFHSRHPGCSTHAFARGKDEAGQSSYERLARAIPTMRSGLTVLDLGCGDGYLLERVRERVGPSATLIGIDMSPHELDAARARLDPADVDLRCERSQATTVAVGSIDAVVSHMALMLMAPLDEVVAEAHRVLRPGGMFAAVVSSDRLPSGAWAEFIGILRGLGAAPTIRIGDRRAYTVEGLRETFKAPRWSEITMEDFELELDGTWPQVEAYLFASYVPDLLESRFRESLRREAAVRIPRLADGRGNIPCRIAMRLLAFRRDAEDAKVNVATGSN